MSETNYREKVDKVNEDIDFDKNKYQVLFKTSMGDITLDMYSDIAPGHCRNILGLVGSGFYDGIIFHRVISGFVIQAGCPQGQGTGGPGYQIDQEFNDTKHVAGILSMARTADPNSGGSQFFLCLGDVASLDNQYTVFGKTADDESLKVLMSIGAVTTQPGDRPVEDVTIEKATFTAV